MNPRRYTYSTSLSWGGDTPTAELDVEVSYLVCWGAPEKGPSYASGGQPADPDEVDDIRVEKINGMPVSEATAFEYMPGETVARIIEKLELSDDHLSDMIAEAAEWEAADYADAMDRRHEEARERWS